MEYIYRSHGNIYLYSLTVGAAEGVVDFFQAAKSACIQRAGLIPDDAYLILKLTSL